ncbi:MAG: class I SAM-dependent methyltransferase [Bdellovibrionota bacterium]
MSQKLYLTGSKNIKDLLIRALSQKNIKNLKILDFPAGSGFTSNYLQERGAVITAWDMFPEFFKSEKLSCGAADLQQTFPAENNKFDMAIFQEGVEHLPNQLYALKEFHRVLKEEGVLFVTTPNYSNLRSRLAYLLFESETPKIMPPNELESLWFGKDNRIYMGHVFSIGIMRLRMLATLAGFRISRIHPSRINWTSFALSILFYPLILLQSFKTYSRAKRKLKIEDNIQKKLILFELLKLNLHPGVLMGGHLIVEFKRLPTPYTPNLEHLSVSET